MNQLTKVLYPPNETIDYLNVNMPYIQTGWSLNMMKSMSLSLKGKASASDLYFTGKRVDIKTDGVDSVYAYNYNTKTINIESTATISSSSIFKETRDSLDGVEGPLNMEELPVHLSSVGYMSYFNVFTSVKSMVDFPLSNLVAKRDVVDRIVARTTDNVPLISATSSDSRLLGLSIFNRGTMLKTFLPMREKVDEVIVINDNISMVRLGDVSLSAPIVSDSYSPTGDNEAVPLAQMSATLFGTSGGVVTTDIANRKEEQVVSIINGLKIDNPAKQESPANKKHTDALLAGYVDRNNPVITNGTINRTVSLEDASLMTVSEMTAYVGDYFKRLNNESIGSIQSYEEYAQGMCFVPYDYLDYTLEVEGGSLYVDYDYSNKYSVLNVGALRRILFEQKGQYHRGMPKVFKASEYFGSRAELNILAAYAQKLGIYLDINKDTIAETYSKINSIVGKLCAMTPDVVPEEEQKIIPEFIGEMIITPPRLPSMSFMPPYSVSSLFLPIYREPIKFFSISPPSPFGIFTPGSGLIFLTKPHYFPEFKGIDIVAPILGNFTPLPASKGTSLDKPSYQDTKLEYFAHEDNYNPYLTIYTHGAECDSRMVLESSRHLNMMEASVILKSLVSDVLTSNYYFKSVTSDEVINKSQMASLILSDVFCAVQGETDMRMSVDMSLLIKIVEEVDDEGGESASSNLCAGFNASSSIDIGRVSLDYHGVAVATDGTVTLNSALSHTEILQVESSPNGIAWEDSRGTSGYNDTVGHYSDLLKAAAQEYGNGKIYEDGPTVVSEDINIASLEHIQTGDALYEYLTGIVNINSGSRIVASASQLGIFTDNAHIARKLLSEVALPATNIVIGNFSSVPDENRRREIVDPAPGPMKIKMWKPLFTSVDARLDGLEYLSLKSDSMAVFSVYSPFVLVYRASGQVYYDAVCTEVTPSTKEVEGTMWRTLDHEEVSLLLYPVSAGAAPTSRLFSRDFQDDWLSPFKLFSSLSLGGSGISPLVSQGDEDRDAIILNIRTNIEEKAGCKSFTPEGTSGIDPSIPENISSLESLDPNAPEQEEGDVPGSYSFSLNAKATKYAPHLRSGQIQDVVISTEVQICITLGVIDGLVDDNGDILAQGEMESGGGTAVEPITYISPHPIWNDYMVLERITVGQYEASKYTIDIAQFIFDKLIDSNTGKRFVEYVDITNGQEEEAEVQLVRSMAKQEEMTPFGTVLLGDFRTPGAVFSYKHAGQDPARPIITGYSGSTEVDFLGGSRLVGTIPTPIPLATYTEAEEAGDAIDNLDLTVNTIHFFINNRTIEVVCRDTKAVFSENRTIKIVMEQ